MQYQIKAITNKQYTAMEAPKYNKARIMKSAWSMFKAGKKYRNHVLNVRRMPKRGLEGRKKFLRQGDEDVPAFQHQ